MGEFLTNSIVQSMTVHISQNTDTKMDLKIQVYLVKDKGENRSKVRALECDASQAYVRGKEGRRRGKEG